MDDGQECLLYKAIEYEKKNLFSTISQANRYALCACRHDAFPKQPTA